MSFENLSVHVFFFCAQHRSDFVLAFAKNANIPVCHIQICQIACYVLMSYIKYNTITSDDSIFYVE